MVCGGVLVGIRGCVLMPWNKAENNTSSDVTLAITRDYGRETILKKDVSYNKNDTVMDLLLNNATVNTEYGGGFVSSIEGLQSTMDSGGKDDWFYFVNGTLCDVGAREYFVKSGDHIWWDYHPWSNDNFIGAVTGAYPQPFASASGENAANIFYTELYENTAREIGNFISDKGARIVYHGSPQDFENNKPSGPSIVIMSFDEAAGMGWASDMLENGSRYGSYASLTGTIPTVFDESGEPAEIGDEIVLEIISLSSGIGDDSPVWFVLCCGEEGANQAYRILVAEPGSLDCSFGAVVGLGGRLFTLPILEAN